MECNGVWPLVILRLFKFAGGTDDGLANTLRFSFIRVQSAGERARNGNVSPRRVMVRGPEDNAASSSDKIAFGEATSIRLDHPMNTPLGSHRQGKGIKKVVGMQCLGSMHLKVHVPARAGCHDDFAVGVRAL